MFYRQRCYAFVRKCSKWAYQFLVLFIDTVMCMCGETNTQLEPYMRKTPNTVFPTRIINIKD